MDWAKAKTILIAIFLAINIYLAYIIIGANTNNISNIDNEKIELVTNYLAEKGITVKGQIPGKKKAMTPITVRQKLFNAEDIAGILFSAEEEVVESNEGGTVTLKGKNIEVSIKNSRELSYTDSGIKPASDIDEKLCRENIDKFLGRLGMKDDDAGVKHTANLEGYMRFTYEQSYKGAPIYNSIMEFYVNNDGIQKARIIWYDTVKQAGKKTVVISPVNALLYLPKHNSRNTLQSKEVIEIQQGYYFGIGAGDQVDVSMVEEGTAFPVWRIITERDIIYINAYNEKVEGIEKAGQ